MTILKIGISLAALITGFLIFLLRTDIMQFKEFLMLLIPAYCIVIIPILVGINTRLEKMRRLPDSTRSTSNGNIRVAVRHAVLWFFAIIFILNIACVSCLYLFSRDGSFNDWKFGHLKTDNPEAFCTLTKDGFRPVAIQNVEAVREARRILLPLRPYIIESGKAHDISPDAVATFILMNRMLRDKYPTYDFHGGAAHIFWHLGTFPEQKVMDDTSPIYKTQWGKLLMRILPAHILLQDRAADYLGGIIMGRSSTMGNMQIKASPIRGFEEEKNVRGDNLWRRMNIDLSGLSDRQISLMLLTDPRLDIEAGVAALRLSIDKLAAMQKERIINAAIDLSSLNDRDWFYIFSEISRNKSGASSPDDSSRSLELHDFTNFFRLLSQDKYRLNFTEFYIIAIQSSVIEDTPGIMVNVTTPEQVDYLRKFTCRDSYLNEAVNRFLAQR